MVTIITGNFTQTGATIHKNGNTQAKIAMVFCVVYCKKDTGAGFTPSLVKM